MPTKESPTAKAKEQMLPLATVRLRLQKALLDLEIESLTATTPSGITESLVVNLENAYRDLLRVLRPRRS